MILMGKFQVNDNRNNHSRVHLNIYREISMGGYVLRVEKEGCEKFHGLVMIIYHHKNICLTGS